MTPKRLDSVDALRGFAMLWMTAFHFSFDLNQFGHIHQNFYHDAFWTGQRTVIVSLFLFCAGLGQAIAVAQGQSWQRFWRRWAQVALCAMLVTVGSWLMFPTSFIYFGVLHGMALMLIVARLTALWGRWIWWLGGLAIASKFIASYALDTWAGGQFSIYFNAPMLNWLGW
ncbi:MAG TPA: heparan-alpha-glucosaminide N-acetyltransferase, partial [Rhodoferax sp.]